MKIGIVAGETSGDFIGAGLIDAIKNRHPEAVFTGICGPKMLALGAVSMCPMDSISIMGIDDLPAQLWNIIRIRRRLTDYLISNPPDVFVGIDVPDFNLRVESALHKRGIKTVHYVSPTVWAWRSYRIRKIRKSVDHMLTLFPFEAEYYRKQFVPVTFVGHPIADEINPNPDMQSLRKNLGIKAKQVVALLPGSRKSEVKRLGPLFIDVAFSLYRNGRDIEFIVPFANEETKGYFSELLIKRNVELPLHLVIGISRQAMAASDVVMLASGTAALEAALLRKPMVVAYKVSWLTGILVKLFAHVQYFSMPNNLLERPTIPELLQEKATTTNLVTAVSRFLDEPTLREEVANQLAGIYDTLKRGANERAADVILSVASHRA